MNTPPSRKKQSEISDLKATHPLGIFQSVAWLPSLFLQAGMAIAAQSFDSNSLKRSGEDAWCWLSNPQSRIVLNPYTRVSNGAAPSPRDLALDLGYFHGSKHQGSRLDNLLSVRLGNEFKASRTWWPHKIEVSAQDASTGTIVRATDFLHDDSTIMRILSAEPTQPHFPVQELAGEISGSVESNSPSTLVINQGGFWIAIATGLTDSLENPPKKLLEGYIVDGDRWRLSLPSQLPPKSNVITAVGISTAAEGKKLAIKRATDAILELPPTKSLESRKAYWDNLLSKVPHPSKFGVSGATTVSPENHKLWYYGAWTFILGQILPPLPENDYPYFSIAEGKPSLWAEGESGSPAQCSWTCFMVMGLIGDIFPEIAWSTYEGIMSRVNDSGILEGECLPSRKAQGAWLIFSETGDKERLAKVYPAIKRYLIWREKNPRWIWGVDRGAHDIPDEKDSSFVVSHLIDMEFAMRIATVLGITEDLNFWNEMTKRELENYRKWFFPKNSPPMNFYFTSSGSHTFKSRQTQEPCYILSGLAFREMPEDLVARLQEYYKSIHDPSKPLVGFTFTKYGETSFMAYGLLERKMMPEATEFITQILADTMRPGADFGEELRFSNGKVITGGVQPSLFLALQTVDFTLLLDGTRVDQGRKVEDFNAIISSKPSTKNRAKQLMPLNEN